MDIEIKSTESEQKTILQTLLTLEVLPHVKSMPQSMIAEQSGIKPSKVRVTLCDLHTAGFIDVIKITEKPKYPRYYYHVTPQGVAFCSGN